ncbi:MAG: AraC family transcriptional regulator [Caldiserica bacterium]|nr:AraC family transcriptional regulator [Caldisericota bacterium]
MEYLRDVQRAADYIEDHLDEDVTTADVADVVGLSMWHFHRIFHAVTGATIQEYVRLRRLDRAAHVLLETKRRIVDIAFDGRFESQEAFSRAFRKAYGMPPGKFRSSGRHLEYLGIHRLTTARLRHLQGGITMEPSNATKAAFTVVGMEYHGRNENKEIPALWESFLPRMDEIQHQVNTDESFGLCISDPDYKQTGVFRYMAGQGVTKGAAVPDGMVAVTVPEATYAVFTHRGTLETLRQTYDYIYGTWLPTSGRELADTPDFELYDGRFDAMSLSSEMDIYIPLKATP